MENAVVKAGVGASLTADPVLAKYAAEIRRLGKRVKDDVVAIGAYLDQAQKHAGRGVWLAWIEAEFGWSDQTAYNFIHLYKAQQDPDEFQNFWSSDLPVSALYQLAKPNCPAEARQRVAERIEAGETPSCAAVAEIIAEAKNGAAEDAGGDDVEDPSTAQHRAAMARIADAEDAPTTAGHEQQILRDLILEEFFAQASGAEIYDRIPTARLNEVVRAFLDKLGVDGVRTRMSEEFGTDLRRQKFAPAERKKSARKWKKSINHRAHERAHGFRH